MSSVLNPNITPLQLHFLMFLTNRALGLEPTRKAIKPGSALAKKKGVVAWTGKGNLFKTDFNIDSEILKIWKKGAKIATGFITIEKFPFMGEHAYILL